MAKANKGKANTDTTNVDATSNGADTGRKRTECPVTRAQFENEAGPVKVVVSIGDQSTAVLADPKIFSSGSFGWYFTDKVALEVDGIPVKCQAQLQFVIVNSKDAAAE